MPFDDPAGFEGTPEGRLEKFRAVRDQFRAQIQTWLAGMALPGSSR
ncbi:MAG: hypothetical protein HJJLKODD_00708 [Phycisphaerae bacterium]|nr:hypothetical protein [Phycisphaerae bacterium]